MSVCFEKLAFEDLSFTYPGNEFTLENCSFDFPMNSVVNINGDYGCGKSTVIKLMATLLEPSGGDYWINNHKANDLSFEELIPYRLRMGYAFDYGGLLNNKSLRENLLLPLQYHKVLAPEAIVERVETLLKRYDLAGVAHHRPAAVSGSQRKLTCVLRSLILHPELLFLDDPSHGLSPAAAETFIADLQERMDAGKLKHIFLVTTDRRLLSQLVQQELWIEGRTIKKKKSFEPMETPA